MSSIMSFQFVLWCGTSHCQENLDFRREPVGCSWLVWGPRAPYSGHLCCRGHWLAWLILVTQILLLHSLWWSAPSQAQVKTLLLVE